VSAPNNDETLNPRDLDAVRGPLSAARRPRNLFSRLEFLIPVMAIGIVAGVWFFSPALSRRADQQHTSISGAYTPPPGPINGGELVPMGDTLLSQRPRTPAPTGSGIPLGQSPPKLTEEQTQTLASNLTAASRGLNATTDGEVRIPPAQVIVPAATPAQIPLPQVPFVPNPSGAGKPPILGATQPQYEPTDDGLPKNSDVMISGGIAPRDRTASSPPPVAATLTTHIPNEDLAAHRAAFYSAPGAPGYSGQRLHDRLSDHEIFAGTPIVLELDDAVDTSLPGPTFVHVLRAVKCSLPPYPVCIPPYSTIVERYNSAVQQGDGRLQVASDVLTMPNGATFDLGGMAGEDITGAAGIPAHVDDHRGHLFTTTLLTAILAAGAQLSQPATSILNAPTAGQQAAGAVGNAVTTTGQQLISQQIQQPPTLTVPRGRIFIVRLASTVIIDPQADEESDHL
jgi:type IV secretion system protein VirB10